MTGLEETRSWAFDNAIATAATESDEEAYRSSFPPILLTSLLPASLCMYVCMCVCVYVCMYVCMYVHIFLQHTSKGKVCIECLIIFCSCRDNPTR